MELMSCPRIGTSETELPWVSEKKKSYTLQVECPSPSKRAVHVCAKKTYRREEAELQAQAVSLPGKQSPVPPEQVLSGPQKGSGHLEKSVLRQ